MRAYGRTRLPEFASAIVGSRFWIEATPGINR